MANPQLVDFFKVIATDKDPVYQKDYITVIEARNYPIYGMMFHPEYQLIDQSAYASNDTISIKLNTRNNEVTQYTYKALSRFIKSQLMANSHSFGRDGLIEQYAIDGHDNHLYSIEDYKMI